MIVFLHPHGYFATDPITNARDFAAAFCADDPLASQPEVVLLMFDNSWGDFATGFAPMEANPDAERSSSAVDKALMCPSAKEDEHKASSNCFAIWVFMQCISRILEPSCRIKLCFVLS